MLNTEVIVSCIKTNIHRSFTLMLILFLSMILYTSCSDDSSNPGTDDNQLEYVTPEDVGYSSTLLDEAKQYAEQSGYAAVMALYDGKVFFSWGNITYNYRCHSIRKPFLGALYGIHVASGDIDLNATLAIG